MAPHDASPATLLGQSPLKQDGANAPVREYYSYADATARIATLFDEIRKVGDLDIPNTTFRPRRDFKSVLRLFTSADAIALLTSFIISCGFASIFNIVLFGRDLMAPDGNAMRFVQFIGLAVGVLVWFEHTGHYRTRMPLWLEAKKVIGTMGAAMMIDTFVLFSAKQDFSRLWLIASWVLAGLMILIARGVLRRLLKAEGRWTVSTLLIGNGPTATQARAALESEASLGYNVTARLDSINDRLRLAGGSWERLCAAYGADYVVVALEGDELARSGEALEQLLREAIPFSVSPPLGRLPVLGMTPQYFFNHDVMLLTRSCGLEQPLPRSVKRAFDIVASGAALLILAPVLLAVAIAVGLDGGPVIFRNVRIGTNGKLFGCLKFRSMIPNTQGVLERYLEENPAEREEWTVKRKLRRDPRVTRVGAFLRRTSLDELPQLINVLRGDMSLVGPRPALPEERSLFGADIAHYTRVRPGITGLWQVSGRNEVSFAGRVQMDSWYVRNWSLWHDIAILCKTIPVLLKRTGAY